MRDHDDEFFEELLDNLVEPYDVLGVPFMASTVVNGDVDARSEVRLLVIEQCLDEAQGSLDDLSLDRLKRLQRGLGLPDVVPFVGAGMSAPAGYPAWGAYLRQCAVPRMPVAQVDAYVAASDYVGLTDAIMALPGGPEYMDERLQVFDCPALLPAQHQLLPALFRGSIYTTNYDRLLEQAYRGTDVRPVVTSRGWDGPKAARVRGDKALLKLHGDVKSPLSRVLSGKEYDDAYAEDGMLRRDLSELFAEFVVVFLGCSLVEDRTLTVALEVAENVRRDTAPNHVAFLPKPEDDEERERHEGFLAKRRIFPIWYPADGGDHSILGRLLWLLAAGAFS